MTKKERYKRVIEYFQENMPVAETELHYANPYELMVAVMLSAQCTDKRVNMITPAFFRRFPDSEALAAATIEEIFEHVKSCSYPNSKAKHLSGMARKVILDYKGEIPSSPEELMTLPGVGRKTANVISLVAFGRPAMPVDTHVFRVSARLGLTTRARNPYAAEVQLVRHFPEPLLPLAHHWLILHGRYVCLARKPKCDVCGLSGICLYYNSGSKKSWDSGFRSHV
ncbi:MAG: endonuclease III [Bacteroidales bacterium]|nr:endonuclease III [Bacteroidales bacterium]